MKNYLIFRTDRIGDFLLTAILIRAIKRNDPGNFIQVIGSNKNYDYIKSFKSVNEVFLLKKGFFNRLKLLILLKRKTYQNIIIHDAKQRSKIIAFFLNKKKLINLRAHSSASHFYEIRCILESLNLNFNISDLDALEGRNLLPTNSDDQISDFKEGYTLFHFDEKWIYNKSISNYTNIEPGVDELISLFNSIVTKTNLNLVISTGLNTANILKKIFSKRFNSKVFLYTNSNFFEIERLINNSNLLISCHGAVSHVAAAKNIKQIDIIDSSYNYSRWTDHFRNYQSLNRKTFLVLSTDIINLL
jgi:ADP-heptose:LPS heptosyltransferase